MTRDSHIRIVVDPARRCACCSHIRSGMPTADADACAASVCGNRVSCSGNAGIDACEYGNAPMERNAVGNSGGGEIERGVLPGGGREDFTDGRYCRARLRRRPLSA